MSISIREYRHSDLGSVLNLATSMHAESKYNSVPFVPAKMAHMLKNIDGESLQCWVLTAYDEEVVGFAVIALEAPFFSHSKIAQDVCIYILPDHREYPAVRQLFRKIELWAASYGAQMLMLGISAPHNYARVGQLYERLGYKPWGSVYCKETL